LVGLAITPAAVCAQEPPAAPPAERLTPIEVRRLFDAYAVVQAQEALGLDSAQYGVFVANYKGLLETRRRMQQERVRIVAELGRLARQGETPDEARIRDRLKALDDLDDRSRAEIRKAVDVVEQPLSLPQRARFRVFEEQMERRKLELLSRARAGAGARIRRGQPQ
jgi:hypothetical protein